MNLKAPIKDAGRIYKMYSGRLEKLGIETFEDFLFHIPNRYNDYSIVSSIGSIQPGEVVTIQGTVTEIKTSYISRFKTLQKAKIDDSTGVVEITWFNQPYLTKTIQEGLKLSVSGTIHQFKNKLTMESPDYELLNDTGNTIHTARLVPIYPETRGITSKWIRRQVYNLLQTERDALVEYLPQNLLDKHGLFPIYQAVEQIHFPDSFETASKARERLGFDEMITIQLAAIKRRSEWRAQKKGFAFNVTKYQKQIDTFLQMLPFELTPSQKQSIEEIFADLIQDKPMNRLLEGDVGSGKTVVSAIAMYVTHLNGYQSVLMAPTEILANQHYATISTLLTPFGIQIDLATGSRKTMNKGNKKYNSTDVLVGTHAVLSKGIELTKLGLVVIDEQQRFGVEQRAILRQKGKNPHLFTMTATPIPRTIALTLYGDLDLSVLSELPKGRKRIKTWLVPEEKRESGYQWIRNEIKQNETQAFIVCPFIEESENMTTVKAATKEFEKLKTDVFPDLKLGLLHGKLKAKEKDTILDDFRDKKIDILVATPVVEVGIDIPNATIIVIEAAERFGLAQLHQLRGRVGRGDQQSYCLLFTDSKTPATIERLKAMETSHSGAELAELDLKMRGSGELYGTRQHGRTKLKVASFADFELIEKTKKAAQELFHKLDEYPQLKDKIEAIAAKQVSPD